MAISKDKIKQVQKIISEYNLNGEISNSDRKVVQEYVLNELDLIQYLETETSKGLSLENEQNFNELISFDYGEKHEEILEVLQTQLIDMLSVKFQNIDKVIGTSNYQEFQEYGTLISHVLDYTDYTDEEFDKIMQYIKGINVFSKEEIEGSNILKYFNRAFVEGLDENLDVSKDRKALETIFEIYLDKYETAQDLLFAKSNLQLPYKMYNTDKGRQEYEQLIKNAEIRIYESTKNQFLENENQENCTQMQLDKFIQNMMLGRRLNRTISEQEIDFVNSQIINGNVNIEDKYILECLLVDKTTHVLKKIGMPDSLVQVIDKEENVLGSNAHEEFMSFEQINYNRKYISQENYIANLTTIFHEIQHSIQFNEIDKKNRLEMLFLVGEQAQPIKMDFLLYDMIKDYILEQEYGREYYANNYFGIQYEIDARIAGNIKTAEYLQSLNVDDKKIIDMMEKVELEKDYDRHLRKENSRVVDKNDKLCTSSMEKLFQLLMNKEGGKLVYDCPYLKMEYRPSRTDEKRYVRKNKLQVLQDYMEWCEEHNIAEEEIIVDEYSENQYYSGIQKDESVLHSEMYAHILNNQNYIRTHAIQLEEMQDIANFIGIQSPKFMAFRDMIVERDILPTLKTWNVDALCKDAILNVEGALAEEGITIENGMESLMTFSKSIEETNPELSDKVKQVVQDVKEKVLLPREKNLEEKAAMESIAQELTISEVKEGVSNIQNIQKHKEKEEESIGESKL